MKLETKYFGSIEVEDNKIVSMKHPIYGFEELSKYVILTDTEIGNDIIWFQSVQEKNICFILANLMQVAPDYHPTVPEEALQQLEVNDTDDLLYFAIMVMADDIKNSTANLKSPIIINPHNNNAIQVILDQDYSLRHRLFDVEGQE